MTVLLVRKTECPDCKEPVEQSYTSEDFLKKFENSFELPWDHEPLLANDGLRIIKNHLFKEFYCDDCAKRRAEYNEELIELNKDYWRNYDISNND
ncbi:hypothetical protein [Niallia taxi]|uniref:hypothetical protein n=1 Tax=Niallia taxi TaxID=2499688 RepID=UPI0015F61B5B|nr:hypothetical protein [Niallia taxi]